MQISEIVNSLDEQIASLQAQLEEIKLVRHSIAKLVHTLPHGKHKEHANKGRKLSLEVRQRMSAAQQIRAAKVKRAAKREAGG